MTAKRSVMLRLSSIALVASSAFVAMSCAGSPTGGADALAPESFELLFVNGQSTPVLAYPLSLSGFVWIRSGRIKSIVAGRSIDSRIFNDRSGNGASGGSSRDSTTASAQVADIRVFEERTLGTGTGGTLVSTHTDTSSATIERRGDLLIITRDAPIAAQVVVDTARFVDGKLVLTVHEWERFGNKANNVQFIYSVTTN